MDRPWPPTPGFFIYREYLGKKPNGRAILGPPQPCCIWEGPPADPITGEMLDRSWRWQAMVSGALVDIDTVWPWVAAEKIERERYEEMRNG